MTHVSRECVEIRFVGDALTLNYIIYCVCVCVGVQADEGPVEEGGQPETQGTAGEEQECPADGGRQEERGQSE